jgi:hypothetical protein
MLLLECVCVQCAAAAAADVDAVMLMLMSTFAAARLSPAAALQALKATPKTQRLHVLCCSFQPGAARANDLPHHRHDHLPSAHAAGYDRSSRGDITQYLKAEPKVSFILPYATLKSQQEQSSCSARNQRNSPPGAFPPAQHHRSSRFPLPRPCQN